MTITIGTTTYDVREGGAVITNKNETLNSAEIFIDHLLSELNIQPLDSVVLNVNGTDYYFVIDKWQKDQISFTPAIYNYKLSLISELKSLEGIILPNLTIKKIPGRTPLSVWYYLNQYLNDYDEKLKQTSPLNYYNKHSFSVAVQTRFSAIECPELQWTQPTLREVLTTLMMIDDCIPSVSNNIISFIDLSTTGSEISDTQKASINYISESQESNEYVSEIRTDMINVSQALIETVEYIPYRRPDGYLMNDTSIEIETQLPIWDLTKLVATAYGYVHYARLEPDDPTGTPSVYTHYTDTRVSISREITDFVSEYDKWRTKDIWYGTFPVTISSDYQNRSLYFKRGQRNILNANQMATGTSFFIKADVLVGAMITGYLKQERAVQLYVDGGLHWCWLDDIVKLPSYTPGGEDEPLDNREIIFQIKYKALNNFPFLASKTPLARNKRQVIDNQTSQFVEANAQGLLEYMKANRLGNKLKIINGRYEDITLIPNLGDKVNNSIIFKREIAYYSNYALVNLYATDNYVLRDYYTGIKSKLRSWKLIDENEALSRNDIIKLYLNEGIENSSFEGQNIPSASLDYEEGDTFVDKIYNYYKDLICVVNFYDSLGMPTGETSITSDNHTYDLFGFIIEKSILKIGNSVVISLKLNSNTIAGKYIYKTQDGDITGGMLQKDVRYTDTNGEYVGGWINFYKVLDEPLTSVNVLTRSKIYPCALYNDLTGYYQEKAKIRAKFHKDSGEIPSFTIQFEYTEEANDMFLGKV